MPLHTISTYLAKVIKNNCIGCGTCIEKCPMEAVHFEDAIAVVDADRCIGCGICSHHCPEDAMQLIRTGPRDMFVPPPKIQN